MAPVHLDGRTLEGGGQIVRNAVAISSLTQIPVRITNIRGRRGPGGKSGGLKAAHLAAVQWLAQVTAADTEGLVLKSEELQFQPLAGSRKNFASSKVWSPVYNNNGEILRLESSIALTSPGAITLILQAILPFLIYGCPEAAPLWMTISGGTNVSSSPSIDYFQYVFFPTLEKTLRMDPIETVIHKRGWTIGHLEVGSVTFKMTPSSVPLNILPFEIGPRGVLSHVRCHILSRDGMIRRAIEQALNKSLGNIIAPTVQTSIRWENSGHDRRVYVLLVADLTGTCRLASDCLYDMHPRSGRSNKNGGNPTAEIADRIEGLVSDTVKGLETELNIADSCLDQYLQDQLVIFQCFANGKARVKGNSKPTLHTETARFVAKTLLGVEFDDAGECIGTSIQGVSVANEQQKQDHHSTIKTK